MKVKVLCRNPDDYKRETKLDLHKVPRNYSPALHPFEGPREYQRALNATKLERVFAKPFLASLDGHRDGVCSMCKHKKKLNSLFSGSCDGELKQWNLTNHECLRTVQAHRGWVRAISCSHNGEQLITVGDDKTIKHWTTDVMAERSHLPINTIATESVYTGVDHQWHGELYATSGQGVDLWKADRNDPVRHYEWGSDSVYSVRWNPVENNIFIGTVADRSIMLYDARSSVAVNKVVLEMRTNVAVFNPMEAFMFLAANEDHNIYSFDMRNLKIASNVHMDHVGAVLDVEYAPTGKEFVAGSYDRSIRIFPVDSGRSREVYHTKRMQRVYCVEWSADNQYVLSGSDETNIRLWKARASEQIGTLAPRQKAAMQYNAALKNKYKHHPQVKRISRHRHVPKSIYSEMKEKRAMTDSIKRKQRNVRKHSKPGSVPHVAERKKAVVSTHIQDDSDEES